ncbi:MAG TPA: homoserine O-acetyltransferase [Microthrixaceae bacterium]|nr:homoserine O-acetyltransferase [Microthrixaceae bacterium]
MNPEASNFPNDNPDIGNAPSSGAWKPGDPVGDRRFSTIVEARPFPLEGGGSLAHIELAHEQWGTLNEDRSNAILICHALTGDSHAAGRAGPGHPAPGWWDALIGPGRAIDTDRYFVVCANALGGCQGSTGPASQNPATGRPYGSKFPMVSIRDMVRTQALLADELGIESWKSVIGGSMGGMQALEWATMYPERVRSSIVASSTTQASAQQIAWSHIGRGVIESDAGFQGGDYYDSAPGLGPHRGLELARMIAQVTYRSDEVFTERFGRTLIRPLDFGTGTQFDVEGYLEYHGSKLVLRFDANSYLRLNRAMDFHDLGRGRGSVESALRRISGQMLVVTVRSDSLYPPIQQTALHEGLLASGGKSELLEIDSPHGHDGFLIETAQMASRVRTFLEEIR